jgi:hypothetical protein
LILFFTFFNLEFDIFFVSIQIQINCYIELLFLTIKEMRLTRFVFWNRRFCFELYDLFSFCYCIDETQSHNQNRLLFFCCQFWIFLLSNYQNFEISIVVVVFEENDRF